VLNGVRPRGAGPGREEARRLLGLAPDQPVVMTVGRLIVMKGQRFLVDSVPQLLERFGDLAVLLVGEGHLRGELSKHAAELGVSSAVRLLGHRADARMLLDAADVFVLPSLHEGMPLAAMEAMDASLPVVGTDVIGTAEVVADGETGLLVPPRDPGALATALGALLSDPDLRARYGAAARRRYLQHFTSARMAADTAAVYDSLLRAAGVVRGPR
jgi:glycosyltransferase involved in cell wall biosynthesis